jgi:hypothetical protein
MNRKFFLAIAAVLLFSSRACGQINTLEIGGPYEARTGSLVRLVAKTQPNETPFWLVLAPSDLDYEQVNDGRRLIFSAGCSKGQRIVVLLLAQQLIDGKIVTRQLRRTVEVVAASELDPDSPSDRPPDIQPDKDWGSSPVFEAASRAMRLVSPDSARKLGPRIADNFDFVAQRCRAGGEIKTKTEIWQQLSKLNREALGELSPGWTPFAIETQSAFQALNLADVPSHQFHLRAAALAIRRQPIPNSQAIGSGPNPSHSNTHSDDSRLP